MTFPAEQLGTFVTEAWSAFRGASQFSEVPAPEASLGMLGEALLDRTFSAATTLMLGVPMPEEVRRQEEEADQLRVLLEEGGFLKDPLSYHRTPPALDDFELTDEATWVGPRRCPYQKLSFASDFEPRPGEPGRERWLAHERNGEATAYVLEHDGPPRPWVVGIHGFGMGTPLVNFVGFPVRMLHEELGLNVIMPVLPLHGPRGSARMSGAEVMGPDYVRMVHLFSQAIWDVRRILQWVRDRGGKKIGLYGISMGGYVSSLVAAIEKDLQALMVSIPMVDFTMSAQDNLPWIMRRYDDDIDMDWETLRAITHVVSPLAVVPKVTKSQRFIFSGIGDRVVRPDQPRALWRHWGKPEIEWFSGGHVLGIFQKGLEPFLRKALAKSDMVYRKRASRPARRKTSKR